MCQYPIVPPIHIPALRNQTNNFFPFICLLDTFFHPLRKVIVRWIDVIDLFPFGLQPRWHRAVPIWWARIVHLLPAVVPVANFFHHVVGSLSVLVFARKHRFLIAGRHGFWLARRIKSRRSHRSDLFYFLTASPASMQLDWTKDVSGKKWPHCQRDVHVFLYKKNTISNIYCFCSSSSGTSSISRSSVLAGSSIALLYAATMSF